MRIRMPRPGAMTMRVRERFRRCFGREATVVARAPGRVNLIGDHTDYTGGLVLPMGIQLAAYAAVAPRGKPGMSVFAAALDQAVELPPDTLDPGLLPMWSRYVYGVRQALRQRGVAIPPADLYIDGEVPLGAGLASSAALEVACAQAMLAMSGVTLPPVELAAACRAAENEYAGSPCGIMDQMISVRARQGCALCIDCRDLSCRPVSLNLGTACLVVIDTGVRHSIAAGEYARRRLECEAALGRLGAVSLREVDPRRLDPAGDALPDPLLRRVRHVVTENERVAEACRALASSDLVRFGALMRASHVSLRDDFEVSCAELDAVVAASVALPEVYGARMTGGGFGGCVVVLLEERAQERLEREVRRLDAPGLQRDLRFLRVVAHEGASITFDAGSRQS